MTWCMIATLLATKEDLKVLTDAFFLPFMLYSQQDEANCTKDESLLHY